MIAVLLADGFEESEALAPTDFLRRCGEEVRTVSVTLSKTVRGAHGIEVCADTTVFDEDLPPLRAVILPGGMPGTANLDASPAVEEILRRTADGNGLLCAICAAPSVLGKRGYLNGKRAICYPGFEEDLHGANWVNRPVVCDGNVITARSAGSAWEFGYSIARRLCPKPICESVREGLFLTFEECE